MKAAASSFCGRINDTQKHSDAARIDIFVYFLTEEAGQASVSVKDVEQCFRECHLRVPKPVAPHMSRGLSSKPPKFIKVDGGYRLERHPKERLAALVGAETAVLDIPADLRRLLEELSEGARKEFLRETLACFGVHAYRATVTLAWLLTLDHLFELILTKHLDAFNKVLAANTDRRVRIASVAVRDDFGEMPEGKFVEFCRSAGVVSGDVRKILDEKLGTRNSVAHPSGVSIQ